MTKVSKTLLGGTSKAVLVAAAIGAAALFAASAANADTITIGLGINGGAVTNEGSAPLSFGIVGVSFDGYTVNNVSGVGNPPLVNPVLLNSNSINVSATGSTNVLDVYVTESGITTLTGVETFISSFTQNLAGLSPGWTTTLQTYVSPADALFGGTLLNSVMFTTAPNTAVDLHTANAGPGPYSVTAEYHVHSNGHAGSSNATINISTVPEPASLMLFGSGLLGLGVFGWRRKQKKA